MTIEDIKNILENEVFPYFKLGNKKPSYCKGNFILLNTLKQKYSNYFCSLSEITYLLRNKDNLENIHIFCPICGKKNNFIGIKNGYSNHCSYKCAHNDNNVLNKYKNTCLQKYGVDNVRKSKEYKDHCKKVKFKRYGDENFNNLLKHKETCLKRYNNKNYTNRQLAKKTCLERYNNENYNNSVKAKLTCLQKYGVDNVRKSEKLKQYIRDIKLKRYGDATFTNREKANKTCLKKYGAKSFLESTIYKDLYKNKEWSDKRVQKIIKTKKRNHTLNTSNSEDIIYQSLIYKFDEDFDNVLYQYNKDKRYPFMCDFYIKSLDLFIEINFDPSHGFEPFDSNNKQHLKIVDEWSQKSKEYALKYNKRSRYDNFIEVWTIRDVKKFQFAKQNNLNYLTFYNWDQFYEWFNKL